MGSEVPGYRISLGSRVARRLLRPVFRGLFHVLGHIKIVGRDRVPKSGAYIIATNHISLYEPPLVLAFWPRPVEALGASDIWERPGQSILARIYSGIPVHRGIIDRKLIKTAIAAIEAGYPLLIMPEGGRSHAPGMRRAARGVAFLAEKTRALIVPVGITGTTDDFFQRAMRAERPHLVMYIGEPFLLPPVQSSGEQRRVDLQNNADLVMHHIARLLPPEYHGVYNDIE